MNRANIIIIKMLSEQHIQKLSIRLKQLKSELNDLLKQFRIESEDVIDQQLHQYLPQGTPIHGLNDSVNGYMEAQKRRDLAKLLTTWIQMKQVDLVEHRNHEELLNIGFIFSPRNSSQETFKHVDHGQVFRNQEQNEIQLQKQETMNHQGAQYEGTPSNNLFNNPQIKQKNAGEEVKSETFSDEKVVPQQSQDSQKYQILIKEEQQFQALQTYPIELASLEKLKFEIQKMRLQNSSSISIIECQFLKIYDELWLQQENLQKVLKQKQGTTVDKIESIIDYLEDGEEDDAPPNQKLINLRLYRDLLRDLPAYKVFIEEKPKILLETSDQIFQALSQRLFLEDKLKLLNDILDQGKDYLYFQGLQMVDQLPNTNQYQQLKGSMDGLVLKQDWVSINAKLISTFVKYEASIQDIILKHSIIHYFISIRQQQNNLLENPTSILSLIKEISSIIQDEKDHQAKEKLTKLVQCFKEGQITIAMQVCEEIQPRHQQRMHLIFQNHQINLFSQHLLVKQRMRQEIQDLNVNQDFKNCQFYNLTMNSIDVSFEMTSIHKSFISLIKKEATQFKQQNFLSIISLVSILHSYENFRLSPQQFITEFTDNQETIKIVKDILDQLEFDQQQQKQIKNELIHENQKNSQNSLASLFDSLQEQDPSFLLLLQRFFEKYPAQNFSKALQIMKEHFSIVQKLRKILSWDELIIEKNHQKLYQVSNFMTININLDYYKVQEEICTLIQSGQKIKQELLIDFLFESIKKKMTFEQFIETLYIKYDPPLIQLTQMNLMCYLLDNCSSELRVMLFLACSSYMPVPLIANRPFQIKISEQQDLDNENEEDYGQEEQKISMISEGQKIDKKLPQYFPKVYEEIIFSFEKFMGVLSFKVNSLKDSRCLQGCTTLTNNALNRQFELHSSSAPIANFGQVEVQFDQNFLEAKFLTVADVHGYLKDTELHTLMSQFNIFIIHCFNDDKDEVKKFTDKINLNSNLILVVMQDQSAKQSFISEKIIQDGFIQFTISSFNNLQKNHLNSLSTHIKDKIMHYAKDWRNYQEQIENIEKRIKVLEQFAEFSVSFNQINNWNFLKVKDQQRITEEIQIIKNEIQFQQDQQHSYLDTVKLIQLFMNNMFENKNQLKGNKVLPFNERYHRICDNEDKIQREYLDPTQLELRRNLIEQELKEIQKIDRQSELSTQIFYILRGQESFIGLISVITKLIKSLLITTINPLMKQREELEEKISNPENIILKNDQIEQIADLTRQIQNQQFSIEFLFREFYIKEKVIEKNISNDPQTIYQPYEKYLQIAQLQIYNGQPFEIIDGDNLRFIHGVYQLLENQYQSCDKILVVSVIGPQSSGKSLLLNSIFGTQFQTSSGRCTRGVYGCLIDVVPQYGNCEYKKILILDTEGIQSTEKKDKSFDNRIVFYILCISHIVFVCNKGEINRDMEELLKIAVYSISTFKGLVEQMPQVNIIMNQISQIDDANLRKTYQNLTQSLAEIGRETNESNLMINIKKENIFFLPMAFSQQGNFNDLQANKSSIEFAKKAEIIKQYIFSFMKQSNPQSQRYTLKSFFEQASKTWENVNNYLQIDKYSSLEQIKQDSALSDRVNKLIIDQFQNDGLIVIKTKIDEEAKQEFEKHKHFDNFTSLSLIQKIDARLIEFKMEIIRNLNEEFDAFCCKEQIQKQVKNYYREIFSRMIETNLLEWQTIINNKVQKFFEDTQSQRGTQILQSIIDNEIMKEGKIYDDQEANSLFEQHWKKILDDRMAQLKNVDFIFNETFENAYFYLRSQSNSFQSKVEDLNMLKNLQNEKFNIQSLQDYFEKKQLTDFFYFTGQQKCRYQDKYDKIGKFIPQLPYYTYVKQREVYNWKKVIVERFNFKNFYEEIDKQLKQGIIKGLLSKVFKQEDKISKIKEKINLEGSVFQIRTANQFDIILQEIATHFNQYQNHKQQNRNFLSEKIHLIKNNVQDYFEYDQFPEYIQQDLYNNKYFNFHKVLNFETSQTVQNSDFYNQARYTQCEKLYESREGFRELLKGEKEINIQNEQLTVNKDIIQNQDESLIQYLNQIQRVDCNLRGNEPTTLSARKYFFQILDKKYIFSQIQRIVIQNVYNKQDDPNNIMEFQKLMKFLSEQKDPDITSQFMQMNTLLFQKVVSQIGELVQKINEEVQLFRLNIFQTGIQSLYQIAQTLITCIYIEIRRINEHSTHFNIEKMVATERRLFVSKITFKDEGQDKNLAEKISNQIINKIKEKSTKIHQDKFEQEINQNLEFFNYQKIIINIEKYILKVGNQFEQSQQNQKYVQRPIQPQQLQEESKEQQIKKFNDFTELVQQKYKEVINDEFLKDRNLTWEQIIQMYVKPHTFFQNCFTQSWNIKTQNVIKSIQESYRNYKIYVLSDLISYFQKLKELMNQKKLNFACNIFQPQISESQVVNEKAQQKICQKALQYYLSKLISRQWDGNDEIQIDKIKVSFKDSQQRVAQNELIEIKLDPEYTRALLQTLDNETISSFQIFVDSLITCFEKQKSEILIIEEKVIIQDLEHKMRGQSTGCLELCPLCRRKCDKIHSERQDQMIHACSATGHQIIGFGGSFFSKTNFTINFGCHELEDTDLVQHEGSSKQWGVFKSLFKQWDFSDNKNKNKEQHQKENIKIWNYIGQAICEEYQKDELKKIIRFREANQNDNKADMHQKIMYILVLDSSSSMFGLKWLNVTSESKRFLATLQNDQNIKKYSSVSIITYNSNASIVIENKSPDPKLMDSVNHLGGDTNFEEPLLLVKKLATKYQLQYDAFHVLFLSDGQSSYPSLAIEQIQQDQGILSKIKMTTVRYYGLFDVLLINFLVQKIVQKQDINYSLQKMAKELGGKFCRALTPEDISTFLLEMIPSIYKHPNP